MNYPSLGRLANKAGGPCLQADSRASLCLGVGWGGGWGAPSFTLDLEPWPPKLCARKPLLRRPVCQFFIPDSVCCKEQGITVLTQYVKAWVSRRSRLCGRSSVPAGT